MTGLAQKLFLERGRQSLEVEKRPKWPILNKLLAGKYLSDIDYALAEHLLSEYPLSGEEEASFICHLSIAARQGHLCVCVENGKVIPDPECLWKEVREKSGEETLYYQELEKLPGLIAKGSSLLPKTLITEQDKVDFGFPSTPVCRLGNLYYFQRNWVCETFIVQCLTSKFTQLPAIGLDLLKVKEEVSSMQLANRLQPEQANAIWQACQNSFTIICGGPGTGKTYTAGQLIRIYWEGISLEQRSNCEIALAAPTGKAAANLQKSLQHAVSELTGFPALKAQTLHSLLKISTTSRRSESTFMEFLSADLIIIDESSMIDVRLMACLLNAIKPGARLILLGDPNQLPPVAEGMIFSDMVGSLTSKIAILKTCLRTDLQAICDFSNLIKNGKAEAAWHFLTLGTESVQCTSSLPQNSRGSSLIEYAAPFFRVDFQQVDSRRLLTIFNEFRILSPLRQGPWGVDQLNLSFAQFLMNSHISGSWFAAPIVITSNDHRLELSNGEVGVLIRRVPKNPKEVTSLQEGDYALFTDRYSDKEVRQFPALLLPRYEYAYCLSVHKSQGSEFDHVLLLLPEESASFGRTVLYTAVTRARKKIEIWGSQTAFQTTVSSYSQRLSGISCRI